VFPFAILGHDVKLGNVRDLAKARGVCVRVCVPENPRGGRVQHTPGPIAGDVTHHPSRKLLIREDSPGDVIHHACTHLASAAWHR
jgi:hypothetical protein